VTDTHPPAAALQKPPAPKGPLGCLATSLAAGVVALLLVVLVGAFILRVARLQRDVVRRGSTAPGLAELRGLGCDLGSTVIDLPKPITLDGAGPQTTASALVACLATEGKAVPSCDDVARAYADAVHPPGTFVAQVRVIRRFRLECQKAYSPSGAFLGDVAE
jgi:hypothetical protein